MGLAESQNADNIRQVPEKKQLILKMDSDVRSVLEFMQTSMSAHRLVSVARAIGELAPVLWGQFQQEEITPLCLAYPPITGDALQQSSASE